MSDREHGELQHFQYKLPNGTQPSVLDVIRIGVSRPQPTLCQPEDWLIDSSPWQLMSRPAPHGASQVLSAAQQRGHLIFGDNHNSISMKHIENRGGVDSLTLVQPENVWWQTRICQEWKKARVFFQLGRRSYDLPLTDPDFTARVQRLDVGDHDDREVQIESGTRYLFVISLGEPWDDGRCYKLVAGVVPIPRDWII